MKGLYSVFYIFCLGLITLARSAQNNINTLGIPPQEVKYFSSARINCKDGSKAFPRDQLNDDFCDCPDGTDEPGTSACPEGKFYCQNSGHMPVILFSSRVNDGICDCCDGSDEYDGKVKCSNTCWEAGKATREKLKKRLATFKEGFAIWKQEIEHAKQLMAKEKAELASLKQEEKKLKVAVEKLKETKEAIEKAEEEERLKREKEEQRIRDAEKKAKDQEASQSLESSSEDSHHLSKEVSESFEQDGNQDKENHVGTEQGVDTENTNGEILLDRTKEEDRDEDNENHVEMEQGIDTENTHGETLQDRLHEEGDKKLDNTEGLSGAELGRLVASRWTREDTDQKVENHDEHDEHDENDEYDESDEKMDNKDGKHHEEYEDYSSEDEEVEKENEDEYDESENKYDEEENTEDYSEAAYSPEAARVRKDYNDLSHKLSKMQSRISKLENKFKQEYGNEGEFYTFYDQCFEHKENKYVYKICPYKQASQVEGHSTTTLGRWGGFKDSYKIMEFSNGDKCWSGPDRSLTIRLKCGLKNELIDVNEPSRCEYVASLLTPALCLEERIKDLQKRLDSLNQEIQDHDEL
ncbi:glucosidase 2 subunit beta isoform X2 [Cryptomeria japonica]|uniref:glucosidase 2 subunit beta isoform X2 n=1 Tax=Cryptomeria japonica TaxID=3369 RepID=UPI0027D9E2D4|nr:glucosidase 2 subunit beta isoform X2 [Cryptomeria japonica]